MVGNFITAEVDRGRVSKLLRERIRQFRTFPMSLQQRGIWFMENLHPGTTAYHVPLSLNLPEPYSLAEVQRAVDATVGHHPCLRTTFATDEPTLQPVQRVHTRLPVVVSHTDLSVLPAGPADARAGELAAQAMTAPFDLETGPLLRFHLIGLPGGPPRLLITLHHLIADGWSLHLLMRDLLGTLEAFRAGRAAPLAPLPCAYHDWSAWQRTGPGGDWRPHLAFYRDVLRDAPPVLDLPTDRPRSPVSGRTAGRHVWTVPPAALARLRERARTGRTTMYSCLLAALATVLLRRSGQEQVVIGTPMANRTHADLQEVIGLFVTVGVVPVRSGDGPAQVHETMLRTLSYQDLPFERLVEELAPRRDPAVHPVFQVMLALQNTPDAWEAEQVHQPTDAAKFDLTFDAVEAPDGLRMTCVYAAGLFDRPTVTRLCDDFTAELA